MFQDTTDNIVTDVVRDSVLQQIKNPKPPVKKTGSELSTMKLAENAIKEVETFGASDGLELGSVTPTTNNINRDDISQLLEHDVTPIKEIINQQLADTQDGWDVAGNLLMQAPLKILGESVSTIGYLSNITQAAQGFESAEHGIAAALKEHGKSISEYGDKTFKIYEEDPNSMNFSDAAFWANLSSGVLATAIPLMFGAGLVTSGLKGAYALTKLPKLAGLGAAILETATTSAVSRGVESLMEANQAKEVAVQKYTSLGYSLDEANKYAATQAAEVYNDNWKLVALDFMQYATISKGLKAARRYGDEVVDAAAKQAIKQTSFQKLLNNKYISKPTDYVHNMVSEAGEEFLQFTFGAEAQYHSDLALGLTNKKETSERYKEYAKDEEAQISALSGAVGGVIFRAAGPRVQSMTEYFEPEEVKTAKKKETQKRVENINSFQPSIDRYKSMIAQADEFEDADAASYMRKSSANTIALTAAMNGNMHHFVDYIDGEIRNEADPAQKEVLNSIKQQALKTETIYNNGVKQHGLQKAPIYTSSIIGIELADQEIKKQEIKQKEIISQIDTKDLSEEGQANLDVRVTLAQNNAQIKASEFLLKNEMTAKPDLEKKHIAELKEENKKLEQLKKDYEKLQEESVQLGVLTKEQLKKEEDIIEKNSDLIFKQLQSSAALATAKKHKIHHQMNLDAVTNMSDKDIARNKTLTKLAEAEKGGLAALEEFGKTQETSHLLLIDKEYKAALATAKLEEKKKRDAAKKKAGQQTGPKPSENIGKTYTTKTGDVGVIVSVDQTTTTVQVKTGVLQIPNNQIDESKIGTQMEEEEDDDQLESLRKQPQLRYLGEHALEAHKNAKNGRTPSPEEIAFSRYFTNLAIPLPELITKIDINLEIDVNATVKDNNVREAVLRVTKDPKNATAEDLELIPIKAFVVKKNSTERVINEGVEIFAYVRAGELSLSMLEQLLKNGEYRTTISRTNNGFLTHIEQTNVLVALDISMKGLRLGFENKGGVFVDHSGTVINNLPSGAGKTRGGFSGGVIAVTPTPQGTYYPVHLKTAYISDGVADMIFDLYMEIVKHPGLMGKAIYDVKIEESFYDKYRDHEDPKVSMFIEYIEKYKEEEENLKRVGTLLMLLVENGSGTKTIDGKRKTTTLYVENRRIQIGVEDSIPMIEVNRETFKNIAKSSLKQNVKKEEVDKPGFKEYLVEAQVLTTDLYGKRGNVFHQPLLYIDGSTPTTERVESEKKKQTPINKQTPIKKQQEEIEKGESVPLANSGEYVPGQLDIPFSVGKEVSLESKAEASTSKTPVFVKKSSGEEAPKKTRNTPKKMSEDTPTIEVSPVVNMNSAKLDVETNPSDEMPSFEIPKMTGKTRSLGSKNETTKNTNEKVDTVETGGVIKNDRGFGTSSTTTESAPSNTALNKMTFSKLNAFYLSLSNRQKKKLGPLSSLISDPLLGLPNGEQLLIDDIKNCRL